VRTSPYSEQRSTRVDDLTGTIRRGIRPAAIVCTGVVILALITLSPLALEFIATNRQVDWTELGNVGQAYGAISAILSALALVAVSISLGLQAKESMANRRQVHRNIHMKLAEMAMNDPILMQCWGPDADKISHDESRRVQFLNLMVSFWYMQWELRDVTDERLRSMATDGLFHTDAGRSFWLDHREQWASNSIGSRLNKFREVMDQALSAALESEIVRYRETHNIVSRSTLEARKIAVSAAGMTAAATAGAIARDLWRRRRST
jgi:Family of unknown function (DUF6082)